MKTLIICLSILFCLSAHSQEVKPWRPVIYFYQDPSILKERIGDEVAVNDLIQNINEKFLKNIISFSAINDDKAVDLIVVFNAKGQKKVWVSTTDTAMKGKYFEAANKMLKEVKIKAHQGVTGLALHYSANGNVQMEKNPPIPAEWDRVIKAKKQIGTTELFNLLLSDKTI